MENKKNSPWIKSNPLIILCLFCFLYYPPLTIGNMIHMIGIFSISYVVLKRKKSFTSMEVGYVLFYVLLFVYLLVSVGSINGQGFGSCTTPIIFVADFLPFVIFLNDYFNKHGMGVDELVGMLLAAALIQGLTSLVSFVSPEIHMYFIDKIVHNGGIELYYSLSQYRMFGFSTGLNFITPCLQGFFAILAVLYSTNHSKLYILVSIILFFSAIINARTSLMVMGVGFVLLILLSRLNLKQKIWTLSSFGAILIIAIFIIIPYISTNANNTFLFIEAGFQQLSGFLLSGKRDTGYFAYVTDPDNYRLPDNFINVLFGKGSFVMSSNIFGYMTDVGYVNDIWFAGLLYVAIYYIEIFRRLHILSKSVDKVISFMAVYLAACFVILNFKGLVFTLNGFMSLLIILYLFCGRRGLIGGTLFKYRVSGSMTFSEGALLNGFEGKR